MSKPRIALMTYAIDNRPAKGTAIVARKHVEALLQQRDLFDLTFVHYEKTVDPIYAHGVREIIFPTFRWSFFNRRFFRQIYYFITTKDRFDVVQWFQPRLYPFFWLVPARRILVTVHGGGDITAPQVFDITRSMFNWSVRLCRGWIDRAIAVSHFARQEIFEAYHIPLEKIEVIPNGVDARFFLKPSPEDVRRVRETYHLPERFLFNMGRHMPHKNVPRLIQAFEEARSQGLPPDVHLVHVGMEGADSKEVETRLQTSIHAAFMHRLRFIEERDLPVLYQLSLGFVFPSLNEGQGMPVLEAMAGGVPVLTSNQTSLREIGEGAALLVDPEDRQAIAQGMVSLVTDQEIVARLKAVGPERARQFSWEEAAQKLLAVYRSLLDV